MKDAVEINSVALIYMPSFIKIGSGVQILIGDKQTRRHDGDRISLF
jgi:hypothetical protein